MRAMAGNFGCITVPIGESSRDLMRCVAAITPTEPTVEKPQTAIPPSLEGSASECKTNGYAVLDSSAMFVALARCISISRSVDSSKVATVI